MLEDAAPDDDGVDGEDEDASGAGVAAAVVGVVAVVVCDHATTTAAGTRRGSPHAARDGKLVAIRCRQ